MTVQTEEIPRVTADSTCGGEMPLPRFTLRKRKANNERPSIGLPSVDSAFLGGLFADVAEIQQTDAPLEPPTQSSPSKKSRASLTRSISRCPKSFKSLGDALFPSTINLSSPHSESEKPGDLTRQITPDCTPSSQSPKFLSHKGIKACAQVPDISGNGSPSFPRLPPAVSVSSCNTMTRTNSDLQSAAAENEEKDTYGWFVEMDETDKDKVTIDPYRKSASASDLAFVAPTAPKADDHDAEVEWAKAADTVDSVLGDFF